MILRQPRSTRTDTLCPNPTLFRSRDATAPEAHAQTACVPSALCRGVARGTADPALDQPVGDARRLALQALADVVHQRQRSEEHTSELQSLMRISYAVFCLKKQKEKNKTYTTSTQYNKNHRKR